MRTFAALLLTGIAATAAAQPAAYIEGTHYDALANAEERGGAVRVTEVLWYGCPACYALEPVISRWKEGLPDDVEFERLPTAFGRAQGMPLIKAYYAARELDVENAVHRDLFVALHERNQRITSEDDLVPLFEAAGVDEGAFRKAFNSFGVDSQARSAETRVRNMRITATPSLIVDGRWLVNSRAADSFEELLRIVDFLVDKARDG